MVIYVLLLGKIYVGTNHVCVNNCVFPCLGDTRKFQGNTKRFSSLCRPSSSFCKVAWPSVKVCAFFFLSSKKKYIKTSRHLNNFKRIYVFAFILFLLNQYQSMDHKYRGNTIYDTYGSLHTNHFKLHAAHYKLHRAH